MSTDPIKQAEEITKEVNNFMRKHGRSVFGRYPLLFSLLGTFGVVLVIHGFDGIVEKISFLSERPALLLVIGIAILVLTGTLYKRIEKKLD